MTTGEQEKVDFGNFERLDIRIGTVLAAKSAGRTLKPAIILQIDFGPELGVKKSSAQITKRYTSAQLIGKQVVAIINFPRKQIGKMMSECLVLGACNENDVVLLQPEAPVINGLKVG